MFLITCVVVYFLMLGFAPDELRVKQHRALGLSYAILVGFLGYFSCGSLKLVAESERSSWAKIGICLFFALIAGLLSYFLWELGLTPVRRTGEP